MRKVFLTAYLFAKVLMRGIVEAQSELLGDPITFKDCWFLFGGLDDIGWTHATNLGRLEVYHYLRAKYPEHKFHTEATLNTFLMPHDEWQPILDRYLRECNLIYYVPSSGMLNGYYEVDDLVAKYPNISWISTPGQTRTYSERPANLFEPDTEWFTNSFVAGAVAGTFSNTCGAFINAFEQCKSCFEHVMGFALGYHWVKPNQTFHVLTMDGYYDPYKEVQAARQTVQKMGCDVFGKHTDPNDVHNFLRDEYKGDVLSIDRYVDMSTFVGDTVFTSQQINFTQRVIEAVESSFRSAVARKPGPMYSMERPLEEKAPLIKGGYDDPMKTQLSPFTSIVDNAKAEEVKELALDYVQKNNPLCGARYRVDGPGNGTLLPTREGEDCPDSLLRSLGANLNPLSYLELPSTKYYDSFPDGGAVCGGGEYYTYDDNLVLSCHPCPENTYRLETGRSEEFCEPCEEGTISKPGSALCNLYFEENLSLPPGVRYYGYFLVTLIAGTAIGFACWVRKNRSHRVVRASQPMFLYVFCSGLLILGFSILPLTVDDSVASVEGCDKACIAFPWLLSFGFCLAFSALFSKIWRINRVMKAAERCKRVQIQVKDVVRPLLAMITLNVILLTLWTALDPPTWSRVKTDVFGTSYGTCWANWGPASTTLACLLILLNLTAVVFANYQSYQARNISDEMAESKYVTLAMASILQILLVGVPLSALVYSEPTAFFFVVSSVIMVISMSLLLLIFVPKVLLLRENERKRTNNSSRMSYGFDLAGTNRSSRSSMVGTSTALAMKETELATANRRIIELEQRIAELESLLRRDNIVEDECTIGQSSHSSALESVQEEDKEEEDEEVANKASYLPCVDEDHYASERTESTNDIGESGHTRTSISINALDIVESDYS